MGAGNSVHYDALLKAIGMLCQRSRERNSIRDAEATILNVGRRA